MTERSFICAISQEQKCQPYFGSHPNQALPEGEKFHSLLLVLKKVTVLMHANLLHATVKMGVPRLNVLILINSTVQWHMLIHSESTLLIRI